MVDVKARVLTALGRLGLSRALAPLDPTLSTHEHTP
jgi:hypothetical protein